MGLALLGWPTWPRPIGTAWGQNKSFLMGFSMVGGIIAICSMYGIFTYIWVIFRAHVDKYSIHGAYGIKRL